MKLDIGCGHNPQGDVNIDPFPSASSHRSGDQRLVDDHPLLTKEIPCFIMAFGEALPLRKRIFDEVYTSHTIEHSHNPQEFLREVCRVTNGGGTVTLSCPHRFAPYRKMRKLHVNYFDLKWFRTAFRTLGFKIIRHRRTLRGFPHPCISLIQLPIDIYLEAKRLIGEGETKHDNK